MRLLTRYVLWEQVKIFFLALFALTLLMLIYGLYKESKDQGLGPLQLVRLIPFILPDMLRFTIPATSLFAATTVFSRMAGSNEVLAIKSLGISPLVILWPAFVLALLLSMLTFWVNEVAVTWGERGVRRVVIEAAEEIVYGVLRTQRSYSTKNFSINVKGIHDRTLINPTFTFEPGRDGRAVTVMAAKAELRAEDDVLKISFHEGSFDAEGGYSYRFDSLERDIPLAIAGEDDNLPPGRLSMRRLSSEYQRIEIALADYQESRCVEVWWALLSGNFESLMRHDWEREKLVVDDWIVHLHRLSTEPPRRLSNAASCLCFVLLGAPYAIWRRNGDFLSSFFTCFFPILLLYYPLLLVGVEQAKSGTLPPIVVWSGNVVIAALGIWVLRAQVLRY